MDQRTLNTLLTAPLDVDECSSVLRRLIEESMFESTPTITLAMLARKAVYCCGDINMDKCHVISNSFYSRLDETLESRTGWWSRRSVAYALLIDAFSQVGCAPPIQGRAKEIQAVAEQLPTVKSLVLNFANRSGLERAQYNLLVVLNSDEKEKRVSLVSYIDYVSLLYWDLVNAYPSKAQARKAADLMFQEIDLVRTWTSDNEVTQALNELRSDVYDEEAR